jgi:uncharacterized NAD-dependent epimerase/dehydratase family protein
MKRRVIVLTEGRSDPYGAKTATNYVRYKPDEVVALLDSTQAGKTAGELLGAGGAIPVVARLEDAPAADTLLVGSSPPGGQLPPAWRAIVRQAVTRGLHIISGMHEFLGDDPELRALAEGSGSRIFDVRKNDVRALATHKDLRDACLRVHTVGHDCNVGKMVVSFELTRALEARGVDAKFVATGQTGIMLEGDGIPIDCVVSDFVNGAAEALVLEHQHHAVLMVEGQGTLVHPMYSGVTLGLLHGCAPHALLMCLQLGRTHIAAVPHKKIPPLRELIALYEQMANLMHPCRVIGIGINSRTVSAGEAATARARLQDELGLPACDVLRDGPEALVEAVLRFDAERRA